jgi:pSer/pThr/pTyr-binding forkhead associated (FHA) protein
MPGAWADPEARGDGKTVFINPDKVKEMMAQPARPGAGVPAGNVDAPTLIFTSGSLAGGRFKLRAAAPGQTSEWTLGSAPGQDIVLAAADGVSGEHAAITNQGERWRISDKLSRNGTFVNNKRTMSSFLSSGDELRLGETACVFQLPGGRAARRASAPAPVGAQRPRTAVWMLAIVAIVAVVAALVLWRFLR